MGSPHRKNTPATVFRAMVEVRRAGIQRWRINLFDRSAGRRGAIAQLLTKRRADLQRLNR